MSIFKQYCNKHNIILHKGDNLYILASLAWNRVLLSKLRLYKLLHGIHKPIVHYYAVCWNEGKMLPFLFQYYDQIVDRYTIYDNYSDDSSEDIILSHKNAKIVKFKTEGFDDTRHNDIKNNCWKQSRGKADFVIVCDIDEFIHSKDIHMSLSSLKNNNYSIVKPFGYNMYSSEYPCYDSERPITEQVKRGVRVPMFDKCIIFDPHSIVEINYKPGAHECHPLGRVKWYMDEEIKLLHFKNIGLNQLLERNRLYVSRLSKENIEKNYGVEYLKKEQTIIQDFNDNLQKAIEII